MRDGPDLTRLGALLGDPARLHMLTALMGGVALTGGELAREAAITPQTGSWHLAQLADGGLVRPRRQGRCVYYELADAQVAELVEQMAGVAAAAGHRRTRPGPRDPQMRRARVCYDHLAGELGVGLLDGLVARRLVEDRDGALSLTPSGGRFVEDFGVDMPALAGGRRPVCKACLDWSERRSHLGGALGRALLARMLESGWARRIEGGRALLFTPTGSAAFEAAFGAAASEAA